MLPILYGEDLISDDVLHGYHCDCSGCDLSSRYPLRAQRDSSCNGEFISRVFDDDGEALVVMDKLQYAAVEADAIPGQTAGFHVHVDSRHLLRDTRREFVWQWLRWEPTMLKLAAGAFRHVRSFNPPTRNIAIACLRGWWGAEETSFYDPDFVRGFTVSNFPWQEVWQWADDLDPSELQDLKSDMVGYFAEADRHHCLSIRTRYDTYEFRLWNSTRSAWRMELFTGLSRLWMDPTFVSKLATVERQSGAEANVEAFIAAIPDERVEALTQRQATYMVEHRDDPDPILAVI